jgi:hypothetical protein
LNRPKDWISTGRLSPPAALDRVMMNRDNLTKRGVTLMRVRHDLALAMFVPPVRGTRFVSPVGGAGRRGMFFGVMSGMNVGRTG